MSLTYSDRLFTNNRPVQTVGQNFFLKDKQTDRLTADFALQSQTVSALSDSERGEE
jgi:hypothetical protein